MVIEGTTDPLQAVFVGDETVLIPKSLATAVGGNEPIELGNSFLRGLFAATKFILATWPCVKIFMHASSV